MKARQRGGGANHHAQRELEIGGLRVQFPFDPYDCQLAFMDAAIHALQRGENALLESPTGTGKTAFLCRCLDKAFCAQRQGPWLALHRRILARHLCTVNDADSLDPRMWARALAGQLFGALQAAESSTWADQARALLGHADEHAFCAWLEGEHSPRAILQQWVLPVLALEGA